MRTKKGGNQKLTLDKPVGYRITVPGHFDESWLEWDSIITVENAYEEDEYPVSFLTGKMDQAALHGVLRRLYSIGLPLISVNLVEEDE
ncbi:MAG: hypothetical protein ACK2T3_00505 [Candidatus Promineifilaceae bacterium]